ncbi:hypothetical protein ACT3TP_07850 [Glutamicibacter sp. AOP38-B1-38]|uniref:hypothetical protein n=1 Tax=Glutamicibacter sp. AOP3-A1-12 TaxID=3457701 RepID=UPI0040339C01
MSASALALNGCAAADHSLQQANQISVPGTTEPEKLPAAGETRAPEKAGASDRAAKQSPNSKATDKTQGPTEAEPRKAPAEWKKAEGGLKVGKDSEAAEKNPKSASKVALDKPVSAGPEAQMSISRIASVKGEANGIGEIAGAATLVEITVTNRGDEQLDLAQAQVRLYYGAEKTPAAALNDSRAKNLDPELAPKESSKAVYIFAAAATDIENVLVEFETGSTDEVQLLSGEVTR